MILNDILGEISLSAMFDELLDEMTGSGIAMLRRCITNDAMRNQKAVVIFPISFSSLALDPLKLPSQVFIYRMRV